MRLVLPPDELKRRIDAFRTLKGMRQVDLAALLEADGFGKQDVGRLERGDIPLTRGRRLSLAEHLGVPERWLVDPDLDLASTNGQPADLAGSLEQLHRKLDLLLLAAGINLPGAPTEAPEIPRYPRQPGEDQRQAK